MLYTLKILPLVISAAVLTACAVPEYTAPSSYVQEQAQIFPESIREAGEKRVYGQWVPYMEYEELMYGKSGGEFREAVRERFSGLRG